MLTIKFKNLRDEIPEPRRRISYYVAKNPLISSYGDLQDDGEMRNGVTGFDWTGVESMGAMSCCYDYDDEESNSYPIGYESKFLEEGEEDPEDNFETFRKVMYLKEDGHISAYAGTFILPFKSDKPEDDEDIEIFWEYEYKIRYQVFSQTAIGQNMFPTPYIEELMQEGLLTVVDEPRFSNHECPHSGYKYKHVCLTFSWLGNIWHVKGSQVGKWDEDAWLNNKYSKMFVYEVNKEKGVL